MDPSNAASPAQRDSVGEARIVESFGRRLDDPSTANAHDFQAHVLPPRVAIFAENIPAELKRDARWAVFKNVIKHTRATTRVTKEPRQARAPHLKAKSNDPATWATFEEAVATYERGEADGILRAFGADEGYVIVDIDNKSKPPLSSGWPDLPPEQQKIAANLAQTYREISPSGRGLHFVGRGKDAKKIPSNEIINVEIYSSGQFISFTGDTNGLPPRPIGDICEAVEDLREQYWQGKAAKKPPKQIRSVQATRSAPANSFGDHSGEAFRVAQALGNARPAGQGYICSCPLRSHGRGRGDQNPSLSVRDGRGTLLVNCFAGCDSGDILAELRRRGLYSGRRGTKDRQPVSPASPAPAPAQLVTRLLGVVRPVPGTPTEIYLASRGLGATSTALGYLDAGLAPGSPYGAMVAVVGGLDGTITALQLTYLTADGRKAPVEVPRRNVGALGYGAVPLAMAGEVLGIAEGVETALSAMRLSNVPTWACLGATRMDRVIIPDFVRELHVFADNDAAGIAAAEQTAKRWRDRRVVIRFPPAGYGDWNDMLLRGRIAA